MSEQPTILHLEDDDRDAELVEAALRADGIALPILRAADAATFERHLARPDLALVLADFSLPSYDGATALDAARAGAPRVPFIFVSGAIGEDTAIEAIRRGATDYVLKHRLDRLAPAVRRALAEAEMRVRREEAEAERDRLLEAERAARQVAEEANRLKDEFLAVVSHELRTPLNAILGWASLLTSGRPSDAATIARGLDAVVRNARIQKRLIEDLLDISRIVSGKLHLHAAAVEVESVVAAAVDAVRPAAAARDVALRVVVEPGVGRLVADGERLQQVVWNLVSNAVKFSPQGGVVDVSARRDEAAVVIQVVDAGCGIDPELLPHVFDRFRQGDGSKTRAHGGLGLGLAIARHLVEMHGGAIAAASDGAGLGATFTVVLPEQASALPTPPRGSRDGTVLTDEGHGRHPSLAGVHILVVDDERDARELLEELLRTAGATVSSQPSAADGLRAFRERRPDVVISDIGMPGEDGHAFIRRLRALPDGTGARTPAIALTAYTREMDRAEARGAGFQHFLSKPIAPELLFEAIARSIAEEGPREGGLEA